MGKSNPNGRGRAGTFTSSIANQFTAGGNAKAGIPSSVGLSTNASIAMFGRNLNCCGRVAGTIPSPAKYPVQLVNQIGGVGRRGYGMFGSNADGVNKSTYNMQVARVRAGPPSWGLY
tara:strand:- start:1230 stop:1580 length:351 start_codon:yes stop_codon:yes gene_type:complete